MVNHATCTPDQLLETLISTCVLENMVFEKKMNALHVLSGYIEYFLNIFCQQTIYMFTLKKMIRI